MNRLLISAMVLLLASCGGIDDRQWQQSAPRPAIGSPTGASSTGRNDIRPDGAVSLQTPDIQVLIRGLVGLTGAELEALLGTPELRRREIPAELWRYGGEECLLHVFLYRDNTGGARVDGGSFRVSYSEILARKRLDENTGSKPSLSQSLEQKAQLTAQQAARLAPCIAGLFPPAH